MRQPSQLADVKIAEGVPVTRVAEELGHSRKSLTLDTYSYVFARRLSADWFLVGAGGWQGRDKLACAVHQDRAPHLIPGECEGESNHE